MLIPSWDPRGWIVTRKQTAVNPTELKRCQDLEMFQNQELKWPWDLTHEVNHALWDKGGQIWGTPFFSWGFMCPMLIPAELLGSTTQTQTACFSPVTVRVRRNPKKKSIKKENAFGKEKKTFISRTSVGFSKKWNNYFSFYCWNKEYFSPKLYLKD